MIIAVSIAILAAVVLASLEIAAAANRRIIWSDADQIAQRLREHLQSHPAVEQLELAGSYRRRRETVGDLDILAAKALRQALESICFSLS